MLLPRATAGTLKRACTHRQSYQTQVQARQSIFDSIETALTTASAVILRSALSVRSPLSTVLERSLKQTFKTLTLRIFSVIVKIRLNILRNVLHVFLIESHLSWPGTLERPPLSRLY